jgi:hypothetical protein
VAVVWPSAKAAEMAATQRNWEDRRLEKRKQREEHAAQIGRASCRERVY